MNQIEKYYNKFNEDKRLLSRHGQVEFFVATKYIDSYISGSPLTILDIGAGTGRYSQYYADKGHKVYAIDLVKKNVSQIKTKNQSIITSQGNALKLKFADNSFDLVILFGPLYHLFSKEDKLKAIKEAKRVTKQGGHIFLMYIMNDYAVLTYAFKEGNLQECLKQNKLDFNFNTKTDIDDLYSYVRIEEINELQKLSGLQREQIVAIDGPTDYMRQVINKMTEKDFEIFKQYVYSISNRPEMLGASSHVMDILKK